MVENEFDVVPTHVPLMPCPFCGGSSEVCIVGENVDGLGMNVYSVVCESCCSVGKPFDNSQDAVAFWNTRTGV